MAFALVYTAEHYVVDVLLGWAYTLAALWLVGRVADWITQRRERAPGAYRRGGS
jgi:membrane-associated phospholipid phosphatase